MNKGNNSYNEEFKRVVESLDGKPSLLLHVCCAPCLASCIDRLYPFFDITLFFYNPNVRPLRERYLRSLEIQRLIKAYPAVKYVELAAGFEEYREAVGDLYGTEEHGKKCDRCIEKRIEVAALKAAELSADYFSTTLSASPLKDAALINELVKKYSAANGIKPLPANFKKENGQLKSKEICDRFGIYRQNYCGCTPRGSYAVAVTGGIGSGKSKFVSFFKEFGANVIGADELVREIESDGTEFSKRITEEIEGSGASGVIDRAALRRIALSDPAKRKLLEDIVHPEVIRRILAGVQSFDGITIVEVPLLAETGGRWMYDYVINIESSEEIRRARVQKRQGGGENYDAFALAQAKEKERRAVADETVVNDGTLGELRAEAERVYGRLKEITAK